MRLPDIGVSIITFSISGTGGRAWNCELSTIDTVLLLAGALAASLYFDRDLAQEREVRELTDALYC